MEMPAEIGLAVGGTGYDPSHSILGAGVSGTYLEGLCDRVGRKEERAVMDNGATENNSKRSSNSAAECRAQHSIPRLR
jgi:hypothetical protein